MILGVRLPRWRRCRAILDNVNCRRIVLHHRHDLPGVRWRPTGAAIAAAASVIHQLSDRNVTVMVLRTGYPDFFTDIFPPTPRLDAPDCALPGVCGLAFAVKVNERAQ